MESKLMTAKIEQSDDYKKKHPEKENLLDRI